MTPNPYFAVEPLPDERTGWHPLSALTTDPQLLRSRVDGVAAALGTPEVRVAASIDFLGVVARVVSPALRSAVTDGVIPELDPDEVFWRDAQPGPMRLALHASSSRPASGQALVDAAVRPVGVPLVAAYHRRFAISPTVLWGNVASALNGAASQLRDPAALRLVAAALSVGELAGTARVPPPHFVRESCCLYYRVPGGGLCGDCVLRARVPD